MFFSILLSQELKSAFEQESYHTGRQRLILTAAVPAGKSNIDAGYDIPNVARNLDFINIMTYDLHGSWDSTTGHNSPLYGRANEDPADATLNMVITKGISVKPNKIYHLVFCPPI